MLRSRSGLLFALLCAASCCAIVQVDAAWEYAPVATWSENDVSSWVHDTLYSSLSSSQMRSVLANLQREHVDGRSLYSLHLQGGLGKMFDAIGVNSVGSRTHLADALKDRLSGKAPSGGAFWFLNPFALAYRTALNAVLFVWMQVEMVGLAHILTIVTKTRTTPMSAISGTAKAVYAATMGALFDRPVPDGGQAEPRAAGMTARAGGLVLSVISWILRTLIWIIHFPFGLIWIRWILSVPVSLLFFLISLIRMLASSFTDLLYMACIGLICYVVLPNVLWQWLLFAVWRIGDAGALHLLYCLLLT